MISVLITTYGEEQWRSLAWERAYPSVAEMDAELIVHHEPDLSIGPARNAAAAQAKGEWFCFLDADDELEPDYLFHMQRAVERNRLSRVLLQPSVQYVRKGRPTPPQLLRSQKDLRNDNHLVIGTLVQRELFFEVGGFEDFPHGYEDWSLWAKCWKAGARVVPVRRAIYIAHVNPSSAHRKMWRQRTEQLYWHKLARHRLFPEEYPDPPRATPRRMIHQELQGWNVQIEKITIQETGDNGAPVDVEGWVLVFTESIPPTKSTVRFAFGKDVRDYIVRELTGGIVLHGGELPRL